MLKISKLADYATLILVHMARINDSLFNARDLATSLHLSVPTVSKLLKLLAKSGLLFSERGSQGGYRLAIAPKKINLLMIISAIDGQFGMTECSHNTSHCFVETHCFTRHNWRFISNTIFQILSAVNLEEMAKSRLTYRNIRLPKAFSRNKAIMIEGT